MQVPQVTSLPTIARTKLEHKLRANGGKYFSVEFTKKDGSIRKLTGRFGVSKDLRGGVNKVVKDDNSYITVYDKDKKSYRTVNLDTVRFVKMNHQVYKVV